MVKDLNEVEWDIFILSKVFEIESTSSGIDQNKLINKEGMIPYITRTDENNGMAHFIGEQSQEYSKNEGNVITIGLDTQTVFYQARDFYTGQNIQILCNERLNKYNALFIIPLLEKLVEKFSWGSYGATLTRLRESRIKLPITSEKDPDWDFMELYIKVNEKIFLKKCKNYLENELDQIDVNNEELSLIDLYSKKWREFFISDIGEIESGKDIYRSERVKGDTPYVSAKSKDNSVSHFIGNKNDSLEPDCISVVRNGSSVGYSFYHPYNALYSNDCRKIRSQKNKHTSLFITNQITFQRGKYCYGYKMGTGRLERQKIMLPIGDNGNPDWDFMELYMKKLEYEKISKYLNYIEDRLN